MAVLQLKKIPEERAAFSKPWQRKRQIAAKWKKIGKRSWESIVKNGRFPGKSSVEFVCGHLTRNQHVG